MVGYFFRKENQTKLKSFSQNVSVFRFFCFVPHSFHFNVLYTLWRYFHVGGLIKFWFSYRIIVQCLVFTKMAAIFETIYIRVNPLHRPLHNRVSVVAFI